MLLLLAAIVVFCCNSCFVRLLTGTARPLMAGMMLLGVVCALPES